MRTLTELAPLAIGLAVVAGITWWLLDRNTGLGRWLLAALLFAHGWVHLMFAFPAPQSSTSDGPTWPFDMGRSWLISGAGLDAGLVRAVGIVLMVVVLASVLLSALSTLGFVVPAGWWAGLIVGSAVGSSLLLGMFFSPTLVLGFAINVALVWLVVASVWSPVASAIPR